MDVNPGMVTLRLLASDERHVSKASVMPRRPGWTSRRVSRPARQGHSQSRESSSAVAAAPVITSGAME